MPAAKSPEFRRRALDLAAGDELPPDVPLIKPMNHEYIDELTLYSLEEMRARVTAPSGRRYYSRGLLC